VPRGDERKNLPVALSGRFEEVNEAIRLCTEVSYSMGSCQRRDVEQEAAGSRVVHVRGRRSGRIGLGRPNGPTFKITEAKGTCLLLDIIDRLRAFLFFKYWILFFKYWIGTDNPLERPSEGPVEAPLTFNAYFVMSAKGKVLVAMSGGVDSSIAAVMLREQGYEVVGITMKTWDYEATGGKSGKEVGCCSLESMNDARSIALTFDFPHFIVDIREEFGDWVIDRFTEEYLAGRTPNPCVLCNTHIKWAALMRRADALGCEYIATGHYARVRFDEDLQRQVIMKGIDHRKDQSYALWGLPQHHLARSIFPLGTYTKPEIRDMARDYGLERVATKPDSYEICFVPDNDYRRFLRDRVPGLRERSAGDASFSKTEPRSGP
jgi:tRNA(Ile)-lysidine synthase TilS/MesJ